MKHREAINTNGIDFELLDKRVVSGELNKENVVVRRDRSIVRQFWSVYEELSDT